MNNPFFAKTENMETIVEHTEELKNNFQKLKKIYPNIKNVDWDILRIVCLYHDLGKMNSKFQNKLIKKINKKYGTSYEVLNDELEGIDEVSHGYLSPAFLPKDELRQIYNNDEMRIIYQSIYFHHSRKKLENHEDVKKIVKEDLNKYIDEFSYNSIKKIKKLYPSYTRYIKSKIPDNDDTEETAKKFIVIKGLLNKIDYAASGHIDVEVSNENLFEKTYGFLECSGFKPNDLQEYMIEHRDDNNIIIASTGIGKTEAALLWIGNNKGFFTLPLKVSINAIYDRVINKIKFDKEKTALLHSETMSEYLKRNDEELDLQYYDMTKQLSLPLTICTLDQLIDFIFKYEGYELKLATLSYSKLVIDEIQMYSPELVAYLIVALKYITEMGGKFSIVTATLPPIFVELMGRKKINLKFNKPDPFYKKINGKVQLRHRIKVLKEDMNIDGIVKNYKDKKILVIVNTIKKAQQIYDDLKAYFKNNEDISINMFHSRYIKKHRARKEREILNMGDKNNKETGIWVTTQVVEASLDIDFDVLFTELSDVSGLLQRMGRVYRSRSLEEEFTNVYVYLGNKKLPSGVGNGDKSIIDKEIFDLSKKYLLEFVEEELKDKYMDEIDKMKLVEKVYSVENLKGKTYYEKIWQTIKKTLDIKYYENNKGDIKLRHIDNVNVIPKNVYDDDREMIEKCLDLINSKEKFNKRLVARDKIKELIVSIPRYMYIKAKNNACIFNTIKLDKYNKIPVISYKYDYEYGIREPENIESFNEENQFL